MSDEPVRTTRPMKFLHYLLMPLLVGFLLRKAQELRVYEDRLEHEKGILSKETLTVSLDSVDKIQVSRGILDRLTSRGTLRVDSKGTGEGYEIELAKLPDAGEVEDEINRLTGV